MIRALLTSIRFLTVLPLPGEGDWDGETIRRSVIWLSVTGLLIGALGALAAAGFVAALPAGPAALAAVFALAALSGGLHLDGLADSADGLLSHRDRDRVLEIFRDSRIGTMGALALFFVLAAKWSLLAVLPAARLPWVVLLMPMCGRMGIGVNVAQLDYARPDGLAAHFFAGGSWLRATFGLLLTAAVGWWALGPAGPAAAAVAALVALIWGAACRRKLGGGTGDTLGAVSELCELVPGVLALALV